MRVKSALVQGSSSFLLSFSFSVQLCSASAPTYAPTKPCSHFPKNQCPKKAFCQWFKNNCVFSINKLQKKLDEMEDSISALETKNDALETALNLKISDIETKNDALEIRLNQKISAENNALETALNQKISDLTTENNALEIRLNQKISAENNALETSLTQKISDLDKENKAFETSRDQQIKHLQTSLGTLYNFYQDNDKEIANLQNDKMDLSDVENLLTGKGYLTTYSLTGINNDVRALQDRSISLGTTQHKVQFPVLTHTSDGQKRYTWSRQIRMTLMKNLGPDGKYNETFCYLTYVSHTSKCRIYIDGLFWALSGAAGDAYSQVECEARCALVSI